jgi:hypothetical protein
MANCNSTGPRAGDLWLDELCGICDALDFVAHQVCAQQGKPAHLVGVVSTLHVLNSYLRIQLGSTPEQARGEVNHG